MLKETRREEISDLHQVSEQSIMIGNKYPWLNNQAEALP
jgi:hypothetical protein